MVENNSSLSTIIIASIIGGLIVYLLLKPKILTSSVQTLTQPTYYNKQDIQPNQPIQILENDENWEFKKDDKGRITGVSVHRKLFDMSNLKI